MALTMQPSISSQPLENSSFAIATEKLTKNYGSNRGIIQLDLQVREGEVFGYLGPNGAGKTTTIRLLLNLITPTSGQALIFGKDCQHFSLEIKKLTGYLPGEFSLFPNLTGAQILKFFGNLRGGIEWAYIKKLAERFDLDLNKKFKQYSHGNKQKVGIIQAFMHKPRLLIVDEPTTGLDPLNQQEFYQMVREAREAGSTIFISSHILSEIEKTCDRVGIIREGRLIKVGNITELMNLKSHHLELSFAGLPPLEAFKALSGVTEVQIVPNSNMLHCTARPEVLGLVVKTAAKYDVLDFNSREATLEEIFLDYYRSPTETH